MVELKINRKLDQPSSKDKIQELSRVAPESRCLRLIKFSLDNCMVNNQITFFLYLARRKKIIQSRRGG